MVYIPIPLPLPFPPPSVSSETCTWRIQKFSKVVSFHKIVFLWYVGMCIVSFLKVNVIATLLWNFWNCFILSEEVLIFSSKLRLFHDLLEAAFYITETTIM